MGAKHFLAVATEWDSGCGGLSTFNRELCIALADLGQRVTCFVPEADGATVARAKRHLVDLVSAPPMPALGWKELLLLPPQGIDSVDIILGHGHITGGQAVALRAHRFTAAQYVHFIHMDSKAIEWHKDPREEDEDTAERAEERFKAELALSKHASLVVAVGPRLHKWFATYLSSGGTRVHEFIPGLSTNTHKHGALPAASCLVLGRADEVSLKGIDVAAEALELARATNAPFSRDVRFTVRGVPPRASDKLMLRLRAIAPKVAVDLEPFTSNREEVLESIRRSALVLMPSREEGFGLAGLEAIGEGVPVLITRASGLAEAMEAHAREHAAAHIIDVDDPRSELAKRICGVIEDQASACDRVTALRDAMAPVFSWERSTKKLLAALDPVSPPPSPPPPAGDGADDAIGELAFRLLKASEALLRWPQRLPAGEWVPRHQEAMLHARLATATAPIALLGPPGCGKSALLARLGERLRAEGVALLAIKADLLPREVFDEASLAQAIGLEGVSISGAVEALAQVRQVVVLIDQLDAVSASIDVETARLTVLLDLISRLAKVSNARILLSCRAFDFSHDARFRTLAVEGVELEPLGKHDVDEVLVGHGIDPQTVTPKLAALLQVPHWLKIFLQLYERAPRLSSSESRHALLEEFWRQRVLAGGPQLEPAALEIAHRMASREELWVARAGLKEFESEIGELEQFDVLRLDAGGLRLSFAHQTLFEFALAKALPATRGALTALVEKRRGSLFVRPLVASALAYLRDVDPERYHAELESLWAAPTLRRHLREMLLAFLGQQTPSLREQAIVLDAANGSLRGSALAAIAGRPSWFASLQASHLPGWMAGGAGFDLAALLQAALPFAHSRVVELLARYWRDDAKKHDVIATILYSASTWDESTMQLATHLIESDGLAEHLVGGMIAAARKVEGSGGAALLTGVALRTRLSRLRSAPPPKTVIPPDATDIDRMRLMMDREPRRSFEVLLKHANGMHGLADTAKAEPAAFLEHVWPWFVAVVSMIADEEERDDENMYRQDHSLATDPHDHGPANHLPQALGIALRHLATSSPSVFDKFVLSEAEHQLMAVHRLLARALTDEAATRARLAVRYLLGDPRRLSIGGYDVDDDTRRLLRAVAPHVDPPEMMQLEQAIRTSAWADEKSPSRSIEARRAAGQLNRDHRIRLWLAIGPERLTDETRSYFEQEARARPRAEEPIVTFTSGTIASPVSLDQMRRMRDQDLLALFATLPDRSDFDHPTRPLVGGSVQASRVFGDLVKADAPRYASLLLNFPTTNQRPAAHGIEGLAQGGLPLEKVEEIVTELHSRGFDAPEFRLLVAYALERRFSPREEMNCATAELLETWLGDSDPGDDRRAAHRAQPQPGPILWGWMGGGLLPGGNYPTLAAMTAGFLRRTEPQYRAWLEVLERHLARREDTAVWCALTPWLPFVVSAGAERGEAFLEQLFATHPGLLGRREGVRLIAETHSWVDGETLRTWMHAVRASGASFADQAYGELLGLLSTRPSAVEWIRDAVESSFTESSCALGLTFAAAHLWNEASRRPSATDLLVRLVPLAQSPLRRDALMKSFDSARILPADAATKRVLEALAANPAVLKGDSVRFVEHLRALLPFEASTIAALATAFVEENGDARGARFWYSGKELTDIAVTLQRLSPDLRDRGLTLFEKLLEQRSSAPHEVLREIDERRREDGAA